ncbi:ThuA domain-containing protein, partial [Streptomyces sp. NPDC048845]
MRTDPQPGPSRRRGRSKGRAWTTAALAVGMTVSMLGGTPAAGAPKFQDLPGGANARVLVFHDSGGTPSARTAAAVEAVETAGAEGPDAEHFTVEETDDPSVFTTNELARYNA